MNWDTLRKGAFWFCGAVALIAAAVVVCTLVVALVAWLLSGFPMEIVAWGVGVGFTLAVLAPSFVMEFYE